MPTHHESKDAIEPVPTMADNVMVADSIMVADHAADKATKGNANVADANVADTAPPGGNRMVSETPAGGSIKAGSVQTVTDTTPAFDQGVLTMATIGGASVTSMGGMELGYVSGQVAGFFNMPDYGRRFGTYNPVTGEYEFSAVRQGAIVGLLPFGSLFGALIAGNIADTMGRRLAISASALFCMIGTIIEITSTSTWVQPALGRLVSGAGIGALSVIVPMYQSESTPARFRGIIIAMYQLFITLGILLANVVCFGTHNMEGSASWRIVVGLSFLPHLFLGAGILFLPESPRFAYRQGREDEARKTIARMAGLDPNAPAVNQQINEIRAKLEEERAGADTRWYEIFTGPRMMYRTVLGVILQSGQQLTGANFFFYYGTTIFKATGLNNSYVTQIILGAVNVACTFGGLYVVKKCGRRSSLIVGAAVMMLCFLVYSFVGHFVLDHDDPSRTPAAGNILIVFSCFFIAAFAMTWGPLVWAVTAELYPAKYRAPAMAVATSCNWFWNFMMSFFTRFVTDAIDYFYGLVFGGCCFVLAGVVYFMLIESKDRTLEQIDTMYEGRVNPIGSSRVAVPALPSEGSATSSPPSREGGPAQQGVELAAISAA